MGMSIGAGNYLPTNFDENECGYRYLISHPDPRHPSHTHTFYIYIIYVSMYIYNIKY